MITRLARARSLGFTAFKRNNHWLSAAASEFANSIEKSLPHDPSKVTDEITQALQEHQRVYEGCIVLEGATNAVNPSVSKALGHSIGQQPSLGHPGDKHERGLHHASKVEVMASGLLCRLFQCKYSEIRPMSGSHAVLFAQMALAKPGDTVLSIPASAGGHATSRPYGGAGYYGLNIQDIAFDEERVTVDLDGLARQCKELKPTLIILGTSLPLFPVPVEDVREIADTVGATVMYDAAHVSGLTAGQCFQQPLHSGAHVMTSSSYKSYGGPPGGFIITNEDAIMERLDKIAFPGLTANFNMSRIAALGLATLDMEVHGAAYASTMVANAKNLAAELVARDVPMFARSKTSTGDSPHTESHIIAVESSSFGGRRNACDTLETAGILASPIGYPLKDNPNGGSGVRLGLAEATRRGMKPGDMAEIADLIAAALVRGEDPATVEMKALRFRRRFTDLHYIRQ